MKGMPQIYNYLITVCTIIITFFEVEDSTLEGRATTVQVVEISEFVCRYLFCCLFTELVIILSIPEVDQVEQE